MEGTFKLMVMIWQRGVGGRVFGYKHCTGRGWW